MGADIQPSEPILDAPVDPPVEQPPPVTDEGDPDRGAKRALDAERKARRDAESRLKEFEAAAKEKADAEKTEVQKATEALASERDARTKAEATLLRFNVAAEKNVPTKLVRFLVGDSKEEIEASADALLAELTNGDRPGVPTKPTERIASGQPSSTLESDDPMALIAKARRHDTGNT